MFVVLTVESVPDHLRGYLERFLQEIRTGVYVGTVTTKVADRIWCVVDENADTGDAFMVRPDDSEAGYKITARTHPRWRLIDHDGWLLSATRGGHPDIAAASKRRDEE